MVSAGPDFPAASVEEARRLFEESGLSQRAIAARLGLTPQSLARRAKKWGWQRGGVVARPLPRRTLIARLVMRIEAEIAAVERLIARAGLEGSTGGGSDAERAARTLAVLVRSLRDLTALERGEQEGEDDKNLDEETPRDAGAYRRELAATLERVLAGRAA